MKISEAEKLIDDLIEKNWLIEINGDIKPNIKLDVNQITMGWNLNKDSLANLEINESSIESNDIVKIDEINKNKKFEINTNLSSKERRLLRYISANTGIIKDEIYRRCLRKKRSLGQVTIYLCLILVAKEQGMDINELI